uniref:Tc1-like transposase DDE domain-containing protein n=1 Tax=Caenorhabditis japonica TaxID=281687 RepID=A0A8R1I252_CAEJA
MELQFITTTETSSLYIETLQKVIVPFFRNRRRSHVFQQDNASIHTSKEAMGTLARCVYKNGTQYNTVQDLKAALLQEWDSISVAELQKLVASMPKQMFKVIQDHGGETSY